MGRSLLLSFLVLVQTGCGGCGKESSHEGSSGVTAQRVEVLVASQTVTKGTPFSSLVVTTKSIPKTMATPEMLTPFTLQGNALRVFTTSAAKGQILYTTTIEKKSDPLSHSLLRVGRAHTLTGKEIGGLSPWIREKDHVDIVLYVPKKSFPKPLKSKGSEENGQQKATSSSSYEEIPPDDIAVTLLQNIVVLKAQSPDHKSGFPGSVTLLLLPKEVEMLTVGRLTGALTLSMRNPKDMGIEEDSQTTFSSLYKRQRRRPPSRAKVLESIKILRGLPKK